VRVVLAAVTRSGRAPVVVEGAWSLRSLEGDEIRTGRGLRADLTMSGADAKLGAIPVPFEGAELVPATDGDLRVGARRYPGVLRVSRSAEGRVRAQIALDVETYLEGVVAGELPPEFPREARRAQAVIARTYLLTQPSVLLGASSIQVDDTGLTDQEFVGIAGDERVRAAVRDAIASTRGLVLHDGAKPLRTWYHSICGGHTCAAAPVFKVPPSAPLSGVECTDCVGTKYYRWTATLPGPKVVKAAGLTGALQEFRLLETTPEGRALWIEIRAGGKSARVHAAEFRLAVGPSLLRSVWVDSAQVSGPDLVVTGRGWGHGVGLCQWGAKGMADRGATAESILAHYYPGAEARRLW
jgi:stage II sporulation protein D